MTIRRAWRAPFSLVAGFATASIGAHFLERAMRTDDEWAQAAYWTLATMLGLITVMEALQVWQELGLAEESKGATR